MFDVSILVLLEDPRQHLPPECHILRNVMFQSLFCWKTLANAQSPRCGWPSGWVSILVLLEDPRQHCKRFPVQKAVGAVSILVLLEDPRQQERFRGKSRLHQVSILVLLEDPRQHDLVQKHGGRNIVSILVLLEDPRQQKLELILRTNGNRFQSLFCWKTLANRSTLLRKAGSIIVSILVLLEDPRQQCRF